MLIENLHLGKVLYQLSFETWAPVIGGIVVGEPRKTECSGRERNLNVNGIVTKNNNDWREHFRRRVTEIEHKGEVSNIRE